MPVIVQNKTNNATISTIPRDQEYQDLRKQKQEKTPEQVTTEAAEAVIKVKNYLSDNTKISESKFNSQVYYKERKLAYYKPQNNQLPVLFTRPGEKSPGLESFVIYQRIKDGTDNEIQIIFRECNQEGRIATTTFAIKHDTLYLKQYPGSLSEKYVDMDEKLLDSFKERINQIDNLSIWPYKASAEDSRQAEHRNSVKRAKGKY